MSINKTIHYCWFGRGKKSDVIIKCMESWKKYMPDWEIIEWNEDNTDLSFCPFLIQAYESKKWAFVSDVIRLKAVYEYGGIYLDTDVEVFSSWESFLDNDAFFFFDNMTSINTGKGFGAKKGCDIVRLMLNEYLQMEFDPENASKFACPNLNTNVIKENVTGFISINSNQVIDNISYFDLETYYKIGKHYGEASWMSEEQSKSLSYTKKENKHSRIKHFLKNKKVYIFFQKHNLKKLEKIYTFLVYDLTDYGFKYWFFRFFYSIKNKIKKK